MWDSHVSGSITGQCTRDLFLVRQSVASIVEFIEGCQKILLNTEGNDVLAYETILEDFSKHLRPTHYLILTVKKFLGDLYGLTEGFTYRELSRKR